MRILSSLPCFSKTFIFFAIFLCALGCSQKKKTPVIQDKIAKADSLVQQAVQSLKKADMGRAMNDLKAALYLHPENIQANVMLGQIFMRTRDYQKAADHFKAVIRLSPKDGQVYFLLAACYDFMDKREMAIETLEKSIEIFRQQRDEANFKRTLGMLHKLKQDFQTSGE